MWNGIQPPISLLAAPEKGTISAAEVIQLDLVEGILTSLFTSTNSDIQRVYYERRADGDKVRYQLYFEKRIAGKPRHIHFSKESTGTHNLLDMFCYLLTACSGRTVVIDEADSGIHDALFWKVLQDTYAHYNGPRELDHGIEKMREHGIMRLTKGRSANHVIQNVHVGV